MCVHRKTTNAPLRKTFRLKNWLANEGCSCGLSEHNHQCRPETLSTSASLDGSQERRRSFVLLLKNSKSYRPNTDTRKRKSPTSLEFRSLLFTSGRPVTR